MFNAHYYFHRMDGRPSISAVAVILAALATIISLSSCGSFNPERLRKEITKEESLWKGSGLRDYEFHYQMGCLCPADAMRQLIITVRDGAVAEAIYADTHTQLAAEALANYPTIDRLFNDLRDGSDGAKDMEVRFDPTYGYPSFMGIEVEGVPKGSNYFKVENLRPLR